MRDKCWWSAVAQYPGIAGAFWLTSISARFSSVAALIRERVPRASYLELLGDNLGGLLGLLKRIQWDLAFRWNIYGVSYSYAQALGCGMDVVRAGAGAFARTF
jgi:hypothetical protein